MSPNAQSFDNFEEHFPKVAYRRLFRFATQTETILLFIGLGFAVIGGILTPIVNNVFGTAVQTLIDIDKDYCVDDKIGHKKCNISDDAFQKLKGIMWRMALLAICQFVAGYIFCICLKWVSEHQVYRTKQLFFESLLRQNIGWHDVQQHSKSISRLVQNGSKIQRATGENLGLCVSLLTSSLIALGNAFYHGGFLTLVSLVLIPFLVWVTYYANALETRCSEEQDLAYGDAGAVAAEVLGNIKTVAAYSGEYKEIERYQKELEPSMVSGIHRGKAMGLSDGLSSMIFFSSTAFTLWLGTFFIFEFRSGNSTWGAANPENILIVYMNLVMAAFEFGEGISYFPIFADGQIAAGNFHQVIDRVSEIDPLSENGKIPPGSLKGNIEIRNLHFAYPSRPADEVLKGINISVKAGQTVALVGHSGSGKSTVLQLLQRLYDPNKGQIMFDEDNIKDLNLGWLRRQIGAVRQEPTLFFGTISENIRLAKPSATDEEIEAVCKLANAHDFIQKFPEKYNTMLGDRGALISGGQKQRLGIARALIKHPSMFLFDEATSALDVESERSIQAALEVARNGRTMLIVAHRLATIQTADLIIFIKDGQVLERGTHAQLYEKRGAYFQLLQSQTFDHKPSKLSKGSITSKSDKHDSTTSVLPIEEDARIELDETAEPVPINKIFKIWMLNFPEWKWLILGGFMSLFQGCVQTLHGILFGNVIRVWGLPDAPETRSAAHLGGIMFLSLALVAGATVMLKGIAFSYSGEILTFRLRSMLFKSMVFQDVAWFDKKPNHLGALCTRLSEDAALIQGVTGIRMGNMIQGITTICISIGCALFYSLKLGTVGIVFVIILNILGYMEEVYLADECEDDVANVENSSMLVAQAVGQIRTIASLHIEQKFLQDYTQCLQITKGVNLKPLHIRGCVMGLSQSFTWFAYIILAFYGSHLMLTEGNLKVGDIVAVCQFITFGTQVAAEALASAPNYYKGKLACRRILKLLETRPTIKRNEGLKIPTDQINGKLEFYRVSFAYGSRLSELILDNVSFHCDVGGHIAIVGPSGCGKSTSVKLIQRLYDPTSGFVKLDDHKLTELDVDSVRRALGVVSQEPALFDRSIAENIAYGDNLRDVIPIQEIIQVAKQADMHDFVTSLSDGYNTRVGQLEGLLSGGQKQRIAIARALIRNPRILLFDEATSALDAETEEVIQHTLDSVSKGLTCVTVSHHPNAIRNADWVLVLDSKGKLVEQGTPAKLIKKSRFFGQFTLGK